MKRACNKARFFVAQKNLQIALVIIHKLTPFSILPLAKVLVHFYEWQLLPTLPTLTLSFVLHYQSEKPSRITSNIFLPLF